MQNSSCKDGEEANSECAKLRKALFFPQETRRKSSEKKERDTNNSCIYHSIAHIVMPGFEICLYNKPETKINQMKSLKLLPKA
jgi:regulator of replication initiation timing